VKIVLIVVAVILCLYLIYLLRRPITWLFIALFIAVALSPAVNFLNRGRVLMLPPRQTAFSPS